MSTPPDSRPSPLGIRGKHLLAPLLPLLLALVATVGGAILLFPGAARASLFHLEGPPPSDLGVGSHGLAPCQFPAHCAKASWAVDDAQGALDHLLPVILAMDGVNLVEVHGSYLHATVTSRLFGFVDDLELFADGAKGQLQARSQSRLGDSDLGVNSRRLERLHQALELRAKPLPTPQI